jgi:ribose 5-phosphate isomerase B
MKKKLLIASDHAGFEMKTILVKYLQDKAHSGGFGPGVDYSIEDMGAHTLVPEDDYPAIMVPVAMRILENPSEIKAIVFGGSGNGEAMIMNRFPEVRAAVYYGGPLDIVKLSREHNDANVLSFGARFITEADMKAAADLWLSTAFSGEARNARRIDMLDNIQ